MKCKKFTNEKNKLSLSIKVVLLSIICLATILLYFIISNILCTSLVHNNDQYIYQLLEFIAINPICIHSKRLPILSGNIEGYSILTVTKYNQHIFLNYIIPHPFLFVSLLCLTTIFPFIIGKFFLKKHNKRIFEQKRYNLFLKHMQGALWEYNILTDCIVKSDPDLGIYMGTSKINNFTKFINQNKSLIHPDDFHNFIQLTNQFKPNISEISCELRAKDISGKYIWFEINGTIIKNRKNIPIIVIGQTNNINERKKIYAELFENAKRDPLTKLYNRCTAEALINEKLLLSKPNNLHAFFMIDIDNFKMINDTYGHTFGDAVLLELSSKLQKTFSSKHILARYGGDEFIAFIPDATSQKHLKDMAQQISTIFHQIYIDETNHQNVMGSIGISVYPKDGHTFDELLLKADKALYYSKNVGKNCFSFYTIDTMSSMAYLPIKNTDTPINYLNGHTQKIIDSSIISNTVDVLCDAKKLNTSINLMLKMIGSYYELDSIRIYEFFNDDIYLSITFEWASSHKQKLIPHFNKIPLSVAQDLAFYKNSSSGIFYHNNATELTYVKSSYTDIIKQLHLGSIFQCAIMEQGQYQGYIEAIRNNPEKPWTKVELNTMTLTIKIIGNYLLKLRVQETANELATKDMLTHSNNIFAFINVASKIIAQNPDAPYILVYTDFHNFKYINDNYGYGEGDYILRNFSHILNEHLNDNETYGRIGADKFIALIKFKNEDVLNSRLNKLNKSINSIKKTITNNYKLILMIGLYKLKPEETDISVCVDHAILASKSITERHKTTYAYFNETMKSRLIKQCEIEEIMEDSLKNKEFKVYYQPKFKLKDGTICGAEALVRWEKKDGNLIYPNDFIPIFEDNGFIVELDFYMLSEVCKEMKQLICLNKKIIPISINFSRVHLRDNTFVPRLASVVTKYKIPPNLIEIEITESALVSKDEYILTTLHQIRKQGFKLSMDDFGSGLSSLNLLRKLPFDILKLDKEFFQKGAATKRERIIIEYIVKMALSLNMEIVSEGVETKEQAQFLKSISCPIAQGYLYEKPIPREIFINKYC